jgi:hypothetical protein
MRRATLLLVGSLALAGCGVPIEGQPGIDGGPFPHEEDYIRVHMDDAEVDDGACLVCHGADEDEQVAGSSALHCSLCHAYPPIHVEADE